MAVISVISHCKETAAQLETALTGRGHMVRPYGAIEASPVGLFVVDLDDDAVEAAKSIRSIVEHPSTALTPVLVAALDESEHAVAVACAYGATGVLRKPFKTVDAVPDTESALAGAGPSGQ